MNIDAQQAILNAYISNNSILWYVCFLDGFQCINIYI